MRFPYLTAALLALVSLVLDPLAAAAQGTVDTATAYMPAPSGVAATDAANFAAAQAKPVRNIAFQVGVYLVPPAGYPEMHAGQEIVGQGPNQTILRLTGQGTYSEGMLYALEKSDIAVRRMTLDYGNFPEPVSKGAVLAFRNGTKVRVEDVNLTGYSRFGFTANGGSDIRYDRGRIIRSTTPKAADGSTIAAGQQNQCVLTSESAGAMSAVTFADIYCKGSGFDTSGADIDFIRTEVDGFDFGFAYVDEQGTNSVRHRYLDTKAHGGRTNPATGQDANATVAGCFEMWAPGSVVSNSDCYDVGGDGVSLGAKNSRVINNRFSKLGMQLAANGIVSRYETLGTYTYSADGSIVSGNTVVNSNGTGDGSNLTNAYYEQDLTANMTVQLFANNFGTKPLTRKSLYAKWGSPGLLLSATAGTYTHTPGTTLSPINVFFLGAVRSSDVIVGVTFKATSGGTDLPAGLRAFAEVDAANSIRFYTQDISGGSSNITVPAGTFTARLISIN